jgi:predicted RNase H-like HicB family nuclease
MTLIDADNEKSCNMLSEYQFCRLDGVPSQDCQLFLGSFRIFDKKYRMEKIISIHVEKLPEGYYLATSDDLQGLVAQGRTIMETLEIARDVAKKLLEAQGNEEFKYELKSFSDSFEYPLVVGI